VRGRLEHALEAADLVEQGVQARRAVGAQQGEVVELAADAAELAQLGQRGEPRCHAGTAARRDADADVGLDAGTVAVMGQAHGVADDHALALEPGHARQHRGSGDAEPARKIGCGRPGVALKQGDQAAVKVVDPHRVRSATEREAREGARFRHGIHSRLHRNCTASPGAQSRFAEAPQSAPFPFRGRLDR
jgi:hypothetical protein